MATADPPPPETTEHPPLIRKDTADLLAPRHEEDNGSTNSTASTSSRHSSQPPSPESSTTTLPSTITNPSDGTCTAPPSIPRLRSQPSIKFAPLPEPQRTTPRRHPPLGIATRGQLMRRRKLIAADTDPENDDLPNSTSHTIVHVYRPPPADTNSKRGKGKTRTQPDEEKCWTREDLASAPRFIEQVVAEHEARKNRRHAGYESSDTEDEETVPVVTIGRIVKGARKHLFRKASNKELRQERSAPPKPPPLPRPGQKLLMPPPPPSPAPKPADDDEHPDPHADPKFERAPGETEGAVWDEEVSDPQRFAAQNRRGL
ncbi:hypothetical protein EV122DRAFT_294763 [Schizophyllum commune]